MEQVAVALAAQVRALVQVWGLVQGTAWEREEAQ
jgi:hypothetical protein